MDQFETPTGIQAKMVDVSAQQVDQASQILALASCRWLFHVMAGLSLIRELLLGTKIDHWVLLAVLTATGLGTVALIHGLSEFVTFPSPGNQLA